MGATLPTHQFATSMGDGWKKGTHKTAYKINFGSCCEGTPLLDMVAGKVSLRKMRSSGNYLKLDMMVDSQNPGMLKAGVRGQPGLHSKTSQKAGARGRQKANCSLGMCEWSWAMGQTLSSPVRDSKANWAY